MDNCSCYHTRKKLVYGNRFFGSWPHEIAVGECWGTRERDECSCGGDTSKCDFYPEKRISKKPSSDKKYKVITLCGSTKFKDAFIKAQKDLTLQGYIVISVGLFGHSGDDVVWTENIKEMLDDMHKRKIDMADEIFVINVDGYIGSSTRSEIEYAQSIGKPVKYLYEGEKE